MAHTAYSQFGAEVRPSPKVPEIFAPPASSVQAAPLAKRSGLGICAIVIAIGALLLGGWSWLYVRQYEDTDDLQIDGNSAVSPRTQGTVTAAHIADEPLH
jgi:multidrug resistance efflux pump